jgi:hypothetical protein
MLSAFSDLVSELYAKWEDCLVQSLRPEQRRYFESILNMTATKDELMRTLYKLTLFLADKFRRNVIVLIDEYEAPNNRAYEHGYFNDVRSPHPSLSRLELRTSIPGQCFFRAWCTSYSLEGNHD